MPIEGEKYTEIGREERARKSDRETERERCGKVSVCDRWSRVRDREKGEIERSIYTRGDRNK